MAQLIKGFNDLATTNPELAAEWNYEKNGDLTPSDVTAGSNKMVWWKKPYDVPMDYPVESLRGKHFDFEWESKINNRKQGYACPYLAGQAVWKGFNDLVTTNPELAVEWNYEKNKGLTNKFGEDISTPDKVMPGSIQKVWWKKSYDVPMDYPVEFLRGKHFDFEWKSEIAKRNKGIGCPYLSKCKPSIWIGFNDLATVNPELAAEWNYEKNGDLTPFDVTANSNQKVWWKLPYDVPMDYPVESLRGKHFDFEWESEIGSRNGGYGCPYLVGKFVWRGFNDLATVNPELAAEWNYEKNGDLTPFDVTVGTNQKVWWKKSYDVPDDYPIKHLRGKHFDFEWESSISSRNVGIDCPYLSGKAVWKGFNDLVTTNPELVAEWNYEKNKGLTNKVGEDISTPDKVNAGSNQSVWWKKSYDVPMDYPVEHLRGKHFDFEWQTAISHRADGQGCPYLSSQALWEGFNDLATTNPELAAEWNYEKNGDLTPSDVMAGSNQKVWWKLPYDVPMDYPVESLRGKHFDFEWECSIAHRTHGMGCPYILPACSKQESYMYMMLFNNNISFNRETKYKTLGKNGRFDIYLPEHNMVIECDGHQHFKPVEHFNTRRSFDDWIKSDNECNDFCKKKGITLLRLPYVIPFNKQWDMVQSVMNGEPIPESIIKFYSRYDFSNYSKIASDMNKGLVSTKISKVKAVPMKSNDVIPDTIEEAYDEPSGNGREFE